MVLGISLINDKVFILKQTDVAVDISYKIKMSEQTNLYFGLKAGGGFTNIDLIESQRSGGDDPLFSRESRFFQPSCRSWNKHDQNEKYYIYSFYSKPFRRGNDMRNKEMLPAVAIDNSHLYIGTGGYHLRLSRNMLMVTPMFMMRNVEGAPDSYDVGAAFLDIHRKSNNWNEL